MGPDRNRIIREEAEAWRRQGHITQEFHAWIQRTYPSESDAGTARSLQTVLLSVAGVLALVGVFTLVSQIWYFFGRGQKFLILCGFAVLCLALGAAAHRARTTRPLTHMLLPLALPLYLFAMHYAQDPSQSGLANRVTAAEAMAVITGVVAALVALVAGLRAWPTLALAAPPALLFAFQALDDFWTPDPAGARMLHWVALAIVLSVHGSLLLLWNGAFVSRRAWLPRSGRLALASNVPWGFFLIIALVDDYAWPPQDAFGTGGYVAPRYDTTLVGVTLTALYLAVLIGFGLRYGLPELTGVAGLFLVGDAIWLGNDKGGVLGAVVAIFLAALALGALAQQGVLLRIFRPREPPKTGPGAPRSAGRPTPTPRTHRTPLRSSGGRDPKIK